MTNTGQNGVFTIHVYGKLKYVLLLVFNRMPHVDIFPHLIFKSISCLWFLSSITHMKVIIQNQEKHNELFRDIAKRLPKNE